MIEHKDIVDAQRHEPKGASTALVNTSYISNGAGSGSWKLLDKENFNITGGTANQIVTLDGSGGIKFKSVPHGRISFVNIPSPYTLAYPAAYTKIAPTTSASGSATEVTESTSARLTYTGLETQHFHIAFTVSCSQSSGSNRDIRLSIFKNGVLIPSSETIQTTTSGVKVSTAIHADEMMSTGDYIELYAKNDGASGDIVVYGVYMFMMGMLES